MKIRLFTIPNMLTLANLLCGSFAAVAALVYGELTLAFALVIAAAVFDFFDGFVARLLHCPSPIGVELDSLADMVSFGFAPAAVLFVLYDDASAYFTWGAMAVSVGHFALFIVAAFSALRLAKFNIDTTQTTEFCGLPTPACAMFCVSLGMLFEQGRVILPQEVVLLLAVCMAFLLISPVRMFSLKFHGFGWEGNQLRYIFMGVSVVTLLLLDAFAIPVLILLYIAISLVRWILMRRIGDDKCV